MKCRFLRYVVCVLLASASCVASAATLWDESVNGDLSNAPLAPTLLNLAIGSNTLSATMPGADLDFFTINVPAGAQFSNLLLTGYSGFDEISFIAIASGTQFPEGPVQTYDPTGLLGYAHFGPGIGDIGGDVLPSLGLENFGVAGFLPPLPSGNYSFWLQQEGPAPTSYQLDFVVTQVPEPATFSLFAISGLGLLSTRRASRKDG
jgi:hypothetical protein